MEHSEPQEPNPAGAQPAGAGDDALRRLEERLERASAAAERLIAEAAAGAAGSAGGKPPPAGWQMPSNVESGRGSADGEMLAQVIQSLRELIPPDLQRRLVEALREVLLAVRAVIDWYLARVDQRGTEPATVQDIPIQ